MPFQTSFTLAGQVTGKILLVLTDDEDPRYEDVADSGSPWLLGSSFQVEEIWDIAVQITDIEKVAIFREYAFNRAKLGNWVIVDSDGVPRAGEADSGYLHYLRQRIAITSNWTVGIGSVGQVLNDGEEAIDNCNYATAEITASVGPGTISLQAPTTNEALFKIRKSARAAAIQNFRVKRRLPKIGLYLFPGVRLTSADYSMAIVNLAPAVGSAYVNSTCNPSTGGCDAEFLAFRRANFPDDSNYPNNYADGRTGLSDGTHIYSSLGAATAATVSPASQQAFLCSDGGTRDYWLANSYPGSEP